MEWTSSRAQKLEYIFRRKKNLEYHLSWAYKDADTLSHADTLAPFSSSVWTSSKLRLRTAFNSGVSPSYSTGETCWQATPVSPSYSTGETYWQAIPVSPSYSTGETCWQAIPVSPSYSTGETYWQATPVSPSYSTGKTYWQATPVSPPTGLLSLPSLRGR